MRNTYPLRLPRSIKAEVVRRIKAGGTSFNQLVATAVSEKLAAVNTAAFFAERRDRAKFATFDKIMKPKGGEAPGPASSRLSQPDGNFESHTTGDVFLQSPQQLRPGLQASNPSRRVLDKVVQPTFHARTISIHCQVAEKTLSRPTMKKRWVSSLRGKRPAKIAALTRIRDLIKRRL